MKTAKNSKSKDAPNRRLAETIISSSEYEAWIIFS